MRRSIAICVVSSLKNSVSYSYAWSFFHMHGPMVILRLLGGRGGSSAGVRRSWALHHVFSCSVLSFANHSIDSARDFCDGGHDTRVLLLVDCSNPFKATAGNHHEHSPKYAPVNYRSAGVDLAEGEGFEPPVPFRVQWFSRPPPSTTRPSLRVEIRPEFAS